MEGGSFSKCGSPQRRAYSFSRFAGVSRIAGRWPSKCSSRLSAVHSRRKHLQEFHGLREGGLQHVALALAPRTF
eukprot:3631940-Pyramimonas_sp.AAC.1